MRPTRDVYFMKMAALVAERSTCYRRSVGCVLVNDRKHVIATGYNGVAAGLPHCNEPHIQLQQGSFTPSRDAEDRGIDPTYYASRYPNLCKGADAPSGQNLDACQAIHAEQNALLQCGNVYDIHTCYTTTLPCLTCMKLLMNTSCERIVYGMSYPHKEAVEDLAKQRGIELIFHPGTP